MEPFLAASGNPLAVPGNPSGSHAIARRALRSLDEAREQVAGVLGCEPGEVVFTSGGTESDNHAVSGGMPPRPGTPVCSAVEHHAVLEPTLALGGESVPVDRLGRVQPAALEQVLRRIGDSGRVVSAVSVMAANNELGTINDLEVLEVAVREHAPRAVFHTDAVQAAPWLDLAETASSADLVSVSAHKVGGPKGTGALVVRNGVDLRPLVAGGAQERGRRGGTHDMAGIAGFAAALVASAESRAERAASTAALRDLLAEAVTGIEGIFETVGPDVAASSGLPADRSHLLPGHLHVMVDGVVGEELLFDLESRGVCASATSSCASGASDGSHVVAAIGLGDSSAAPLRLSLGADTTREMVDIATDALTASVAHLRGTTRTGTVR